MGILDKIGLKKKKDAEDSKEPKKQDKKQQKTEAEDKAKDESQKKSAQKSPKASSGSNAYKVLVKPLISEKATMLAIDNKYVFEVNRNANKNEVKKSIEDLYSVDVEWVNIMNVSGKTRRYGRTTGKTASWKKAIIKVRKGQKIPGIIETV